jgi:hypothetical protein
MYTALSIIFRKGSAERNKEYRINVDVVLKGLSKN